ncbi:hypothetical protein OB905_11635 [Halobacteria archaeon AArc-dxtr1]|nr:hypothetical protein [Halobacteria archaeon AArc-dxtr1]
MGSSGERAASVTPVPSRADRERTAETVSAPATVVGTVLATAVGAIVLAVGTDVLLPGVVAALAGSLLTGTVSAANRRTPGGRAIASVLTVLAAVAATAAGAIAVVGGPTSIAVGYRLGVVAAIGLAAFGATATVTGAIGDGAVRAAIPIAVATAVPIAIVGAVHTDPARSVWGERGGDADAVNVGIVSELALSPTGSVTAMATFVGLVVWALWVVAAVGPRLPIPQLLARDRREPARRQIERVSTAATRYGFLVFLFGSGATIAIAVSDGIEVEAAAQAVATLETLLLPVATSTGLRIVLLAGIAVMAVLFVLSWLPGLRRLRHSRLLAWLPAFTGGAVVASLLIVGYPMLFERVLRPELEGTTEQTVAVPGTGVVPVADVQAVLAPPSGIAIASVATVAVVGLVVTLLVGVWGIGALALLPDRAAPGSFGAAALVLGAIVAAVGGAGTLVVAIPVACAMVSWDAALYGVSITEELGRDGSARRPAIVHITGTAVVAGTGVGVALGLLALTETVVVQPRLTALGALIVALIAVWIALKRRALRVGRRDEERDDEARTDATGSSGNPGDESPPHAKAPRRRHSSEQSDGAARTERARSDLAVSEMTLPELYGVEVAILREHGFETIGDLQAATATELETIDGINATRASVIVDAARDDHQHRQQSR